jgi:hypothetical protein
MDPDWKRDDIDSTPIFQRHSDRERAQPALLD